jgi:alpha-1,2-mannosyltransferase
MLKAWDGWVDERRLKLYGLTLVGLYLAVAALWVALSADGIDPKGKPLGYDFLTFYSAAKLALEGRAVAAFDPAAIFAAQQAAVPANQMIFLWHYPPPFHLIVTPLGVLSYYPAYWLFLTATLPIYLLLARRISDHPLALVLALALPAAFVNAFHGQNAFLNTALFGFGLLLLERRPFLGRVLIGLLAYKPHLAILLPFALAAAGHWRSFAAAAVTAVCFCAISTLAFGLDYWVAWCRNLAVVAQVLEAGNLPWAKMPTAFAFASLLGAPTRLAYTLQIATAAPVALATVWAWRREGPLALKIALLATATLMMSPYLFDYDLVLMAIPIGILAERMRRSCEPEGAALLVVIAMTPLICPAVAEATRIQVMPFAVAALFLLSWRALAKERQAGLGRVLRLAHP